MTFNLARDPWLPVIDDDGTYHLVGLLQAFAGAQHYTVAAGGGLEDTALTRLLLAISYSALGSPPTYPCRFDAAAATSVAEWIKAHDEVFALTESDRPFFQDASLAQDSDSAVLLPGVINPRLARARPKLTDWRELDAAPTMSFDAAARWMIVQLAYSVGGRHKGISGSLPESPLTGLIAYRPVGTISDVLTWMRIPVAALGEANWTWTPRPEAGTGVRGVRCEGELDALTWLSRRYLLHHDGTQVTGIQNQCGWRRAPEPDSTQPADSAPGRHDLAVSASSVTKPAKASAIGGRTWRAASGDPVELAAAWERGGPDSLSRYIRDAHGHNRPQIVAVGHQIESKVLWQGAFTTLLPTATPADEVTQRAVLVSKARFMARTFGSTLDTSLLDLTLPADDKSRLQALKEHLDPHTRTPSEDMPTWPVETRGMWDRPLADAPSVPADLSLNSDVLDMLRSASGIASTNAPAPPTPIEQLWLRLTDIGYAQRIADITRTRIPSAGDLDPSGGIDLSDDATRLWAGLAATWLASSPSPRWKDSSTPFPLAVRHACAASRSNSGAALITAMTHTSPRPSALRTALLAALQLLAANRKPPSWRSLHHDLTHWNRTIATQWRNAYWAKPATNGNTTTMKDKSK